MTHMAFDPSAPPAPETDFETFLSLDIRVGTVLEAAPLDGLRKPSMKLVIDFGEGVGVKKSAAQITGNYAAAELVGRQVMAVVNFPPRQIGPFRSEVLTLGAADDAGAIRLVGPDAGLPDGARLA